jgi:hypothetical protein
MPVPRDIEVSTATVLTPVCIHIRTDEVVVIIAVFLVEGAIIVVVRVP